MKIKLSDYLAGLLVEHGIRHVFTVTGGGAMHLNDSFGNHPGLACVFDHHEQACAMAAEGYYKTSFRLPAVCVTTGPGGTNALTGVLGAWLDSIPMLVISGQVKNICTVGSLDFPLRQLGDQEYPIVETVRPMTKYAVMVRNPADIRYCLERALYLALHGRPGPVWLDIPLDVQAALIDPEALRGYDPAEDAACLPPKIDDKPVRLIAEKIRNAKRPAILAGAGVRLSGGFEVFQKLVRQLQVPVMTAWNSNDLICDDDPLYAGRPGTVGTRGGNFVFQSCDVLLVLGCRMNLRQIGYNWARVAPSAYKIMVDIDENELKKPTFRPQFPLCADAADFMRRLLKTGVSFAGPGSDTWRAWCSQINRKYPVVREDDIPAEMGINPYWFIRKLSQAESEGQITVASNGSACVCGFQAAVVKPGQRLFSNSGCASMGYGLPAAVGACVASGKSVVCLEGDGSLQMNIQELQTVIHNRLPMKLFVLNNNGYHSIRQTQSHFFPGRFTGIDRKSGVSFPDLSKIAEAYGFPFTRIDSAAGAEEKIGGILKSAGPALCEVVVDPKQNFEPKSASKLLPNGSMVSTELDDMYPFLPEDELAGDRIWQTNGKEPEQLH